ncbi:rRNA maturation RNase YbeY [Kangiella taiwanensis]|uniref:Endoribonuclease YbeY n=1 Tax=Kangiella taiwanensis TaxID=1079179 RepID=A0ABP8HYD6_9GAMM|nr:rRNA maturation RNase YbeY [Kangiella taiwanensis]
MSTVDLELQIADDAADNLPEEKQFLAWAQVAVSKVLQSTKPASLTIRIVSRDESQELNHQYRGKARPTNVLSFPFELPQGLPQDLLPEERILGDLAVCAEVVAAEAQQQDKLLHDHWAHMVVHGCLHLLGYDHIKDEEAEIMEALEAEILAGLGISNPYIIE